MTDSGKPQLVLCSQINLEIELDELQKTTSLIFKKYNVEFFRIRRLLKGNLAREEILNKKNWLIRIL